MAGFSDVMERRRLRATRDPAGLENLYKKVKWSRHLQIHTESATGAGARKIIAEARKQFVVSLVTVLEVYLADLTLEMIDSSGVIYEDKIFEHLKEKYTLADVASILKDKITLGELICKQMNFQNADSTFTFLSHLFTNDFSKVLRENRFSYPNQAGNRTTISLRKDFRNSLAKLLKLRHSLVHDMSFRNTPSRKLLRRYDKLVRYLATCIDVQADQFRSYPIDSKILPK